MEVMEATVNDLAADAGEKPHASALELPAAVVTTTPASCMVAMASLMAWLKPPPRDMLATAGLTWFSATQFMPPITDAQEPPPAQSNTRTPWRVAARATP